MAKKKQTPGMTRQGVKDLNYIKGKPVGIRLPMPPEEGLNCPHPTTAIREDAMSGVTTCTKCGQAWDFDGHPF